MEKRSRYTDAQNKATQKYIAANMEEIRFRAYKRERLNDLIRSAADRRSISKAAYMQDAIKARLDADGVTLDTLPPDDAPHD